MFHGRTMIDDIIPFYPFKRQSHKMVKRVIVMKVSYEPLQQVVVKSLLLVKVFVCERERASVIRQKDEFQNGGNKKKKHAKLSDKTSISYSQIRTRTCAYQGVRNVHFFGKFVVFCFLATSVLIFVLLHYYRRRFIFRAILQLCLIPLQRYSL